MEPENRNAGEPQDGSVARSREVVRSLQRPLSLSLAATSSYCLHSLLSAEYAASDRRVPPSQPPFNTYTHTVPEAKVYFVFI